MGTGYANPTTLPELFAAMTAMPRHHLFAGGTDLLVRKERGVLQLENIISLHRMAPLRGIREKDGRLELGALCSHAELESHPLLRKIAWSLCQAAGQVGSLQIRNLGTLGGNLCNASPAADTATPLLTLDARMHLASAAGERDLPAHEFFTGPGKTVLQPGEILHHVSIPLTPPTGCRAGSSFYKLARRKALAISVVNGSAWVCAEGGAEPRVVAARVALGAVAPVPLRLTELEEWLKGRTLTKETLDEAGKRTEALVKPISDIRSTADYRRETSGVLVTRLLCEAAAQAKEGCCS